MSSFAEEFRPAVPYIAPMAMFLVLTQLEGMVPEFAGSGTYPIVYTIKMLIVAVVMVACRSAWRDFRPLPDAFGLALAVGVGLAVTAIWVGLDGLYPPLPFGGGERAAFDPNVLPEGGKYAFLAIRFLGLVLLVPVFEELFWRSWLMRWLIDSDFRKVPIGQVTLTAAVVTSVGFALVHPEWLPALVTGFAWAWLLWKSKSVSACVVSHLVANLGLGVYVLATGEWKYW